MDIKSSKIKFGKHRLRMQVVAIVFLSFFITIAYFAVATAIVYLSTSDAIEAEEFADYIERQVPLEVDNIHEIGQWSGWDRMDDDWRVEVYDSDGLLVFTNSKYMLMPNFWLQTEREIEGLDAYIVINSITGKKTGARMDSIRLSAWFVFMLVFSMLFRKIERYTYKISDGISILAGGEMNHRIPLENHNELTMIAGNINCMAEALQVRTREKEKSDKERDDVITNLAHDIRTPITVLEGYLNMLINDDSMSKEKQKEYLEISLSKCNELTDRADNIFEYVRLNNKREELDLKIINARQYITDKFEEMTMILAREGFKFDVDIALSENDIVKIDESVTQRVFDNLLSNITKYADTISPITFKAYSKGNNVIVKLGNRSKDAITMDAHRLFERTVSGDESRNAKSEGLGLAICKLVMEMQSGKINAEVKDEYIEFTLQFIN